MQQYRDTLLVGGATFLLVTLILIARPFYTPVEVSEEAQALTSGDTTIEEALEGNVVTEAEEAAVEIEPDEEATQEAEMTEEATQEAEMTEEATQETEMTEEATQEAEMTEEATQETEMTEEATQETEMTEEATQAPEPTATFAPMDLGEPSANDPTFSQ